VKDGTEMKVPGATAVVWATDQMATSSIPLHLLVQVSHGSHLTTQSSRTTLTSAKEGFP